MLATVSVISIAINTAYGAVAGSWAYDEPKNNASHWPDYYAECGYSRQSPIDIPLHYDCDEPLELQWQSELSHFAIRNTGTSLLAMPFAINYNGGADLSGLEVLHHRNDTNIRLKNSFYHTYESGVNKEYCFDSLHFHWGRNDNEGSEHTVNGESFPLEVHLVHYSCDYEQAGPAIGDYISGKSEIKYDDENVLAVVGVIFEIGKPNLVLDKILDDVIIDGIYEKKSSGDSNLLELYYTEFSLKGLLPESREMISYLGSLTTPPCLETVRWHVLKERMTVSEEQMETFRTLLSSEDVNDTQYPNFRPPLPLNDRTVYQCLEDIVDDAIFEDDDAKDAFISYEEDKVEAEEETSNSGSSMSMTESELIWRMIGIAFICLFMISIVICLVASICLCKNWERIFGAEQDKFSSNDRHDSHKHQRSPSMSGGGNTQNARPIGGIHHI